VARETESGLMRRVRVDLARVVVAFVVAAAAGIALSVVLK
jgi:ABC-type nitrate/sulfonate/bicarbonate transport system permease component